MGGKIYRKDSTSKTIHVDFKTREMVKVEECEYLGKTVRPGLLYADGEHRELDDLLNLDNSNLHTDPARLLEMAIQTFEEACNQQDLFDQTKYTDPQVLYNAIQTFAILQREIPMLLDTMGTIQDLITIQTGVDPATNKNIGGK